MAFTIPPIVITIGAILGLIFGILFLLDKIIGIDILRMIPFFPLMK